MSELGRRGGVFVFDGNCEICELTAERCTGWKSMKNTEFVPYELVAENLCENFGISLQDAKNYAVYIDQSSGTVLLGHKAIARLLRLSNSRFLGLIGVVLDLRPLSSLFAFVYSVISTHRFTLSRFVSKKK